jgi:hypothetical protein
MAGLAGGLLVLALILFVVSFLIDVVRWLAIVAAVVLIAGIALGAVGRRGDSG